MTTPPHSRIPFLVCMVLLLMGISAPVLHAETISSFHSVITVDTDGSLLVKETVTLHVDKDDTAVTGMERAFPTSVPNAYGIRQDVTVSIIDVTRNEMHENYHVRHQWNRLLLSIGERDITLKPDHYTYVITYRTNPQVEIAHGTGTIRWDCTGYNQSIPIAEVTTRLTIPHTDLTHSTIRAGVGNRGGMPNGRDVTVEFTPKDTFIIKTKRALGPHQGLQIIVTFPSGSMKRAHTSLLAFLRSNPTLTFSISALLIACIGYGLLWLVGGRGTKRGPIVPRYAPPDKMSPAVARYLLLHKYDHKMLAATLVDMASKGMLSILRNGTIFSITLIDNEATRAKNEKKTYDLDKGGFLPPTVTREERLLAGLLLRAESTFAFVPEHCESVKYAIAHLKDRLQARHDKLFFHDTSIFVIMGLVFACLLVIAVGVLDATEYGWRESMRSAVGLLMTGMAIFGAGAYALPSWHQTLATRVEQLSAIGRSVLLTAAILAFGIVGVYLLWWSSVILLCFLLAMAGIVLGFTRLFRVHTTHGQQVLDELEGFRQFLAEGRLDHRHAAPPPERTPELFEQYLPYAMALDVEVAWAEQCGPFLPHTAPDGVGYVPEWYRTHDHRYGTLRAVIQQLGHDFPQGIANASISPNSLLEDEV